MSKFLRSLFIGMLLCSTGVLAQQLPDPHFEDWSGSDFDGNIQPKYWHGSNVEQAGFKFNFTYREAGRTGYSVMVKDQKVGAMGITEVGPGYFSLGNAWQYLSGISTGTATAGTVGGIAFTYRPDSVSVWIRRTGNKTADEDFHILFYSWVGETRGDKYRNKSGDCQATTRYDEESDIRQALDGNDCGTAVKGTQVAEGWLYDRKYYGEWTNIKVPIFYMNNTVPEKCNMLFSASNYPNFRANSGLFEGNAIYVDDVELIYSSKIHTLYVGGKEWKGFDPNDTGVQVYSLPESATAVPDIEAMRGAGTLTNSKGTTVAFPGRSLTGKEISIEKGDLVSKPTKITVKAEDGSSTTVYQIQFQKAASSNAKLANIQVNGTTIAGFSPTKYNYTVDLPYGTTAAPVVTAEGQEEAQSIAITQATSPTGTAKIVVTAANKTATASYSIEFRVAALADNTLKDIKVNGKSVPGFTPSQTIYKVSLPENTTSMPTIEAVSAYPAGAQTITKTPPATIDGGQYQISVTTPGNPVAKVYKLNFKLEKSSYTYLQDIQLDGKSIDGFEPTKLTYRISLPMGTTALPEITWTQGDEFQKVEKTSLGTGVVDGTVVITVTAGNGAQEHYNLEFVTEKSSNSTLKMIYLDGEPLEGFSENELFYTVSLPIGTSALPEITWEKGDEYQTVVPTLGGLNGKTRITVTAGDGSTKVYQIAFSVQLATVATLNSILVGGVEIPGFDPEVFEYSYSLPKGTTIETMPEVTYVRHDAFQSITVRNGGVNGDYKITVRPQSGNSNTYIIHFSVATSSNTTLAALSVAGYPLLNSAGDTVLFDPAVREYHVTLAEGVSKIPAVSFVKAEETQRVLSVLEDTVQTITVTAQSGAKADYKIYFKIQLSANAFLDMIYLDGKPLEGFNPNVGSYEVMLLTPTCPKITVDKSAGQQVTITAPYATGTATILVSPEVGASNTYTIDFLPVPSEGVQLANILIDGVGVTGFQPTINHYEATFEKSHPTVEGVKADLAQTIQVMWTADTCWLHVADTLGSTASYYVAFTRTTSSNTALAAIKADGELIETPFDPTKTEYSFTLPAGSDYPTLSYEKGDASQIVTLGQVSDGKWKIHVVAEDGTAADYTVQYAITKNNDVQLENITLLNLPDGETFTFDPDTKTYSGITLDEGRELPDVQIKAKAGQTVMSYNAGENEQHIVVTAEDGTTDTYIITYARKLSSNASLKSIYVGSKRLAGFEPDEFIYSVTLPHGTNVVPNVFPIGQLNNQTITTYFGTPNDTTRIHVISQDGTVETDYFIAFSVEKSNNTRLKTLKINGVEHSTDTTDYTFNMPFGAVETYAVTYEAEEGQLAHFQEAPISEETKIIVTSESGESTRTYSIRYKVATPKDANIIKKIDYQYVTKESAVVPGSINNPKVGENKVTVPYGAKFFEITNYEKNYPEQAVLFYNGGIRRGAKLVAVANRDEEDEVEYTIIPEMEADTVGKLKDLRFNDTTIINFSPDVYNYIVNVTDQPEKDDFVGVAFGGKTVTNSDIDPKKKQITLTVADGSVYSVCWFYENDKDPFDFRADWVPTTYNGASKPSEDWHVYTDFTEGNPDMEFAWYPIPFYAGKEVVRYGENGVLLSTMRQGAIRCSVPGMMTLGSMTADFKKGSLASTDATSSVGKDATLGVQFRNTPEQLTFEYSRLRAIELNEWKIWITLSDGTNFVESTYDGDYSELNQTPTKAVLNLTYPSTVTNKLNATLNSCNKENCKDLGSLYGKIAGDLVLQNMHLTYNSELTAVTINGKPTVKSGNTFTYNLEPGEVITGTPNLKFTCGVHDQMQTIEWLNNGEWINGELKATVVNYGENAFEELRDSTVYTVVLHRDPVTAFTYTADFGGYDTTRVGDTTYVNMPYGTKTLPDFSIVPSSTHQIYQITKKNKAITVKVTNENGADSTTVYIFREIKSDDAMLEFFDYEGITVVDPDNLLYSVTAAAIPTIDYEKKTGIHQYIDLHYTADQALLTVTAENGATRTYTVNRIEPTVVTNGQISNFYEGTKKIDGFGGTNFALAANQSDSIYISFARAFAQDTVVFIQAMDKMEWRVSGSEQHTYTWTYPNELSDNALLSNILIDGVAYSEFADARFDYTADPIYTSDSICVHPVEAEPVQKIAVTPTYEDNGTTYAITVTAEDNIASKTYKLRVDRPKSNDNTLASILVNGVQIANFNPAVTAYTVTLPSPAVKTAQQTMPSITYLAGHPGQKIMLTQGSIGESEPVLITVTSEDGKASQDYTVTVLAEKSHCTDLTGIMINGVAVEGFEPGRHYYSVELNTSDIDVQYAADDRFQTVEVQKSGNNRILHVTAEDGTTTTDYYVTIFVQSLSSDATLANILLETTDEKGTRLVEIVDFMRELNPNAKRFDPGLNTYEINLPSGTTVPPAVSAQLKKDGQTVEITKSGMKIFIEVTPQDTTAAHNTYELDFIVPLSTNANLSMIFLNGDSLKGFTPDDYFYQIELEEGEHELREVAAQKGDATQTIQQIDATKETLRTTITVTAEDTTRVNKYVVVFHFNKSKADTLSMIYADGDSLSVITDEGDTIRVFEPKTFRYSFELPVGTDAFPDLSWDEADEWQTITMDTTDYLEKQFIRREIMVVAESGLKNTYTVSHTILKSTVDTLRTIFVNNVAIPNFKADSTEYFCQLTIDQAAELNGAMPLVTWTEGDEYQIVDTTSVPDINADKMKCLPFKKIVTVTADAGNKRVYTIHYPIDLSANKLLKNIYVAGDSLAGFYPSKGDYDAVSSPAQLRLEQGVALPVVTWTKGEDIQKVELTTGQDSVFLHVTAENGEQMIYTLAFERKKSDVKLLRDIVLTDAEGQTLSTGLFAFRPEIPEYDIALPYDPTGADILPTITYELYDPLQTVSRQDHNLPNGDVMVSIHVLAPNEEDESEYSLTFHFTRNNDARVLDLAIKGATLNDFSADQTEYEYRLPYGSDESAFVTLDQVTYVLSDSLAQDTCFMDDDKTIFVRVLAQDGTTETTYIIRQYVGLDDDCSLATIELDGIEIEDFDSEVTFYTYQLWDGQNPPMVTALPNSENADVSIRAVSAGDTCTILCTAMDGTEKRYYIHFAVSEINTDATATTGSVLMKRVPGEPKIFVATIRKDVTFFLFDQYGHLLFSAPVPVADPNDVDVYIDLNGDEVLNNVGTTGVEVEINIGQIYFYAFRSSTKVIQSGKFIGLP